MLYHPYPLPINKKITISTTTSTTTKDITGTEILNCNQGSYKDNLQEFSSKLKIAIVITCE